MKKFIFSWIGMFLICSTSISFAGSNKHYNKYQKNSIASCKWVESADGVIPVPFDLFNKSVELASGQFYALEGTVFFLNGYPYLDIDVESFPWLGRPNSYNNPSYPLYERDVDWDKFKYKKIKIIVRANGEILKDYYGESYYQIYLDPIVYQ